MVVKITMPASLQRVLGYNEQKVLKGVATCIGGGYFLGEVTSMNRQQKLSLFERRNELNDRAATKMIHLSLNFDPSEKPDIQKLLNIAAVYMEKTGFSGQPYLVYEHHDAGHPHIHIVSTTIRADGSRINTHNIGRNQSSLARKEIEEIFHLVKAERKQKTKAVQKVQAQAVAVFYGKAETKQSIAGVTGAVIDTFSYTSLAELNAVLRLYNVVAENGGENSRMRTRGGLCYRILDNGGSKTGVAIPAGALPGKPTLTYLEQRFTENKEGRRPFQIALRQTLDAVLLQQPSSLGRFEHLLAQKQVSVLLRTNKEGRQYGITFIDGVNKSVFNGSELGKGYGWSALRKKFASLPSEPDRVPPVSGSIAHPSIHCSHTKAEIIHGKDKTSVLSHLLSPIPDREQIPHPFLPKKGNRKKKRRHS